VSEVTKHVIVRSLAVGVVVLLAAAAVAAVLLRPRTAAPVGAQPAHRVPGAVVPAPAPSVLPAVDQDAPVPSMRSLADRLRPLIASTALGGSTSVDVLDPITGAHLLSVSASTARTPASTAKLLTSAAALTSLGAQATLATQVVSDGAGRVVLVGGGDVLLGRGASDPGAVDGRAGLATLARDTATALKVAGARSVRIRLDDGLFTGPRTAKGWSPSDVGNGFVAPVQPIEIDAGRLRSEDYAPRASDPAMAAAQTFAGLLRRQGVRIPGSVRRGAAPDGAPVLAEVVSAPLGDQVEFALTRSDNTVAEALGRLVAAKAGRRAAFTSVGPAVLDVVRRLGVPVTGAVMADGSGLADGSRISAVTLTELLATATGAENPQLRPILSGLPIAGVSGTLLERFTARNQRAATGVVRAKTGTLMGVSALAGTVVDVDGRLLVFAAMAEKVSATTSARNALERLVTTLASCGCR
jgi:D-alanyl-D-alanine carboxypeptidase/D-alanyl-D-alanine-endopeptidase (penicillin-binding protein 4)